MSVEEEIGVANAATEVDASPGSSPDLGPRATLLMLRICSVFVLLLVCVQPVLAGVYLSGEVDAIVPHRMIGTAALGITSLLQIIAAILVAWKGNGSFRPVFLGAVVLVFVILQMQLGFLDLIAVHVPLGVVLVLGQVVLTARVFNSESRRPRGQEVTR